MTLMDTKQAADYLGLTENTLRNWRYQKKGPPFMKLGNGKKASIRYTPSDLDAWLNNARKSFRK